mgnify:CR=1 FL=1
MSELAELEPRSSTAPVAVAKPAGPQVLSKAQKAAIIIGILGAEAAGPILEQLEEAVGDLPMGHQEVHEGVHLGQAAGVVPEVVGHVAGNFIVQTMVVATGK